MRAQVDYYDRFGKMFAESILDCPEPEYWTTDYAEKGRIYREMKARLQVQQDLVGKYFRPEFPLLDIGCGFGRQAVWLARNGYRVTGVDSSPIFIDIARELFQKHGLRGEFALALLRDYQAQELFRQVILFDVLEHFPVSERKEMVAAIARMTEAGGVLLASVPVVKDRWRSRFNNRVIRGIKSRLHFLRNREEHPFPIPVRSDMDRLFLKDFELLEFLHSAATEYYIFRRRK